MNKQSDILTTNISRLEKAIEAVAADAVIASASPEIKAKIGKIVADIRLLTIDGLDAIGNDKKMAKIDARFLRILAELTELDRWYEQQKRGG